MSFERFKTVILLEAQALDRGTNTSLLIKSISAKVAVQYGVCEIAYLCKHHHIVPSMIPYFATSTKNSYA